MSKIISLKNLLFSNLIFRYAVAGGTASLLDVLLLYVFTDLLHIYYLVSAVITTTVSFLFRFFMQKYFAFQKTSVISMHFELLYYSLLYTGSMLATIGLLYLFVEKFGLWYIAAQIISILIIASVSFFVYKIVIFKNRP